MAAARPALHLLPLLLLLLACAPAAVRCADCWVPVFNYHHYEVDGPCLKGTIVNKTCTKIAWLGYGMAGPGRRADVDYQGSLEKCCDEVYGGALGDQFLRGASSDWLFDRARRMREQCLMDGRRGLLKNFIVFKAQDLPADEDVHPFDGQAGKYQDFVRVCGGVAAVAKACAASSSAAAFTYGGEGDCGYLKGGYWDANNPAGGLKFAPNSKGWDTYVKDIALPKQAVAGGTDPCVNPTIMACGVKANSFPKPSGAFKV